MGRAVFYRARYFDANTGRFLSEDPIGFAGQDQNLYRYVFNNPVNFTDPSGLLVFALAPLAPIVLPGIEIAVSTQLALASAAAIAAGSAILNEVGDTLEDLQKQTEEAERNRKDPCNASTGTPNNSPPPQGPQGPRSRAMEILDAIVKGIDVLFGD